MPKIKVDHVVSFSSEDQNHPASNLLNADPAKKWKCKTQGEKQAYVILQLEKASIISSIDIGNEHSAYVEVLVARSGSTKDSNYKVLLVMSSFMTPLESRQSSNVNKVRMFTTDQLSSPEREEKWDRVKIVCTQPFNRHIQYGLSFITLHSPEDKTTTAPVQQTIGKFVLRPPSPDDITVGSTFLTKKLSAESSSVSAAAAIRDAAASPNQSPFRTKLFDKKQEATGDVEKKPRNRDDVLYKKDEEEHNEKVDKIMEKKKNETARKKEEVEKTPKNEKRASNAKKRRSETENNKAPSKKMKQNVTKPFTELLSGVTIVVSGIQNPDRANLRTMALSMGAKYKPDWDNTCTHLICAFVNTPKFNQVKGKGKIVTRKWLEDCNSQRKRLPWRRYALDRADQGKPESEDEIWEETVAESVDENDDDATDIEEAVADVKAEASDTEDEIARITAKLQKLEEKSDENDPELLPNFFEGKMFHLDTALNYKDRELLIRYIIAYSGTIVKKPEKDVSIIITNEDNADYVKNVCGDDVVCISPDWVWQCHNSQKVVPFDDFKF